MSTHPDTPNDLDLWNDDDLWYADRLLNPQEYAADPHVRRYPCCGAWWEDGCQCESDLHVSRDRWGEDTGNAILDAFYGNGDRMEDAEYGLRDRWGHDTGRAVLDTFHTQDGA